MITVFTRTIIIYIVLLLAMRLMGKRQIGELEVSELIITLMLSELAVGPITNKNLPLLHAIIPIFLLLSLEVIISFLLTKSNRLKKLLYGKPIILIMNGKINLQALSANRIQIDELTAELRQQNAPDIHAIKYAILEDNGKLSVILKAEKASAAAEIQGLQPIDHGIAHELIIDGEIQKDVLTLMHKNQTWLYQQLEKQQVSLRDVFLFTLDDAGETHLYRKD